MPLRIGTWTGRGAGYCGTSDFATSQFIHTTNRPPGSARQKIADVPSLSKAAWGATGDIIFAPSNRSPLYLVWNYSTPPLARLVEGAIPRWSQDRANRQSRFAGLTGVTLIFFWQLGGLL